MNDLSVWSLRQWAEAIVELEVGPLPSRTVIVPRLRVGHALKRELAELAPKALVGTIFVTPSLAAREVLSLNGVELEPGEEAIRPVRLQQWFAQRPSLQHFDVDVLHDARGWADAFARTVGELEAAGVTAADLRVHGNAHLDDLALAAEALGRLAGSSVTNDALLQRATHVLASGGAWPWAGESLAVVSGHESGVQAAFLRSVPRLTIRGLVARPATKRWAHRTKALFPAVSSHSASGQHEKSATQELELLKAFLFADPQVLADPARARSKGRDGSVELEEHSGVDSELEATADWLVRQVQVGIPLDQIAVLVPHAEPLVSLVRSRLQRVPWGDAPLPVFVAGGEAAVNTGTGARVLALLRALASWLPVAALAELLPSLRTSDDERVSRDEAVELVSSLGTLGGSPGRPAGARDWLPAAKAAHQRLERRIAVLADLEGTDEEESEVRRLGHLRDQLASLGRLLPALEGLDGLAELLLRDAPLSEFWPQFADFLLSSKWLRLPIDSIDVAAALKASMEQAGIEDVRGSASLALIEDTLGRLRRNTGRYGEPRLYVGTVRGAVGLGFDAVRIIGLAEGSIPPSLREDAVLDSSLRERLKLPALATRELRSLLEVQSVFRVVVEARKHVTFSFPRADLSGSVHESSSLFIEVAAALGRPNAVTHEPAKAVPRGSELARDAFAPARKSQREARLSRPVGESAWLDRTALLRADMPRHWARIPAFDPLRVERVSTTERGALDGYLGEVAAGLVMRGLSEELPLSASRLKTLLECPHRYLLQNVLYWGEPASTQQTGAFDALTYGTLVHSVLERFGREHGERLSSGSERDLKAALGTVADDEFTRLVDRYALLGEQVREVERRRMHRDLAVFFEADWASRKSRKFDSVERSFALPLSVDGEPLFVHGFIDRVDTAGKTTFVRDYKTGRAHPRKGANEGPTPELDAQIALYGLVTRKLAKTWELPAKVHVAYAYANTHEPLRLFQDDAEVLFEAAERWLKVARALLVNRTFPRRPAMEACTFCAFKVVCGTGGPNRSGRWLASPKPGVEALLAELWGTIPEEETES